LNKADNSIALVDLNPQLLVIMPQVSKLIIVPVIEPQTKIINMSATLSHEERDLGWPKDWAYHKKSVLLESAIFFDNEVVFNVYL
jgi:hypothetical protein